MRVPWLLSKGTTGGTKLLPLGRLRRGSRYLPLRSSRRTRVAHGAVAARRLQYMIVQDYGERVVGEVALSTQIDPDWSAEKNAAHVGLLVLVGRIGMRPAIDVRGAVAARPAAREVRAPSRRVPRELGAIRSRAHTPCVLLDIGPHAPPRPGTASGRAIRRRLLSRDGVSPR